MLTRKYIPMLVLAVIAAASIPALAQHRQQPPAQGQQQNGPHGYGQWRDNQDNQNRDNNQNAGTYQGNTNSNGTTNNNGSPRGGDWLRNHSNLPPQERQKALQNDPQFQKLPPDLQNRLRDRLQRFSSLPPNEQQRMLQRMDRWNRLNPQQKEQARGLFQQFQSLPEDRRKAMVQAFHNLRAFPPDQQQRILNSPQFRSQFSDNERNIMRGMNDLKVGPAQGNPGENEQ